MAQPNVAREPSMEEILASIRRIIESNDPEDANANAGFAETPAEEASPAQEPVSQTPALVEDESGADSDISLTVDGTFDEVDADAEVDAEDVGSATQPAPVATQAAAEPAKPAEEAKPEASKPSSLADVAARVRAGAESARQAPSSPVVTAQMQGLAAAKKPEAETQTSTTAATVPAGTPVTTVSFKPQNIVSKETETKVSQSFDDLVAALNAKPQRSLDELAEEMLRPMLREWLDDNLPPLVERLVREEIERVARGPKG